MTAIGKLIQDLRIAKQLCQSHTTFRDNTGTGALIPFAIDLLLVKLEYTYIVLVINIQLLPNGHLAN